MPRLRQNGFLEVQDAAAFIANYFHQQRLIIDLISFYFHPFS